MEPLNNTLSTAFRFRNCVIQRFLMMALSTIFLVMLDQAGKILAQKYFTYPVAVIRPFLSFSYVENKGILFGLPFTGMPLLIVNALAVIALLILIFKYVNTKNRATIIPPMMILAGSVGNLIDRLMLGYVRDFIKIGSWPVFNFADILITVGCLLSIVFYQIIFRTYP